MNSTLIAHFSILPDPRRINHHGKRHELLDIVIITIIAVIGGANNWAQVAQFGRTREEWFKSFLTLENGIPSEDTFGRVFSILDPDAFQKCFLSWVTSVYKNTKGAIVAIDGKSTRSSFSVQEYPLHLISAFATENGVTLGQRAVDSKTNEITEIPKLLDTLMLKGCIVTIDAMGCQKDIAEKIVENKGDYLLAVKGNQKTLHKDLIELFNSVEGADSPLYDYARTEEHSHGRNEIRECWTTNTLRSIRNASSWKKLKTVVRITDTRTIKGKTSAATRYFISSATLPASRALSTVRAHWRIENTLHWSLDIIFREDDSRIRMGHAQQNFSLVRKLALMLLRNEKSTKDSVPLKRLRAAMEPKYILDILDSWL
jgi:predicted transposase YbfD/YdcC